MQFTPRQQEIINYAIEIIAVDGFFALTTKNLAAKVGISEPGLYRHFSNKQAILLAILDYFEGLADQVIIDSQLYNLKGMARLDAFIRNRISFFYHHPRLAKLMLADSNFQDNPALASKSLAIMAKHRHNMRDALQEAITLGETRTDIPAEHLFFMAVGTIRLITSKWLISGCQFNLEAQATELWTSIKKIICS